MWYNDMGIIPLGGIIMAGKNKGPKVAVRFRSAARARRGTKNLGHGRVSQAKAAIREFTR